MEHGQHQMQNKIQMTNDEEADEIIKRLSKPNPRAFITRWTFESAVELQHEYGIEIAKAIAEEIDNEIFNSLTKGKK